MLQRWILVLLLTGGLLAVTCGPMLPTPAPVPGPQANPARDTTPPVISSIKIERGSFDVPILWQTNEPTTGRIDYGSSDQYGLSSPWTEELTTSNGIGMPADLEVMNTYHLRVRVKDAAGNETVSQDMVIVIGEAGDIQLPLLKK